MALAALRPFGPIALTMLRDKYTPPRDMHQQFIQDRYVGAHGLQSCFFTVVWVTSYQVVCKRNHMVLHEGLRMGNSVVGIISQQSAFGGMWDFSADMDILFLVIACYVFGLFVSTSWRVCRN